MVNRVLIAEDDEDTRIVYKTIIKTSFGSDIIIDEVEDGKEEIEFAKRNKYNVIISDGNMKRLDGLVAAEILRGLGITTPIVMVSGLIGIEEEAKKRGVTEFYSKPIKSANLYPILKKYLYK